MFVHRTILLLSRSLTIFRFLLVLCVGGNVVSTAGVTSWLVFIDTSGCTVSDKISPSTTHGSRFDIYEFMELWMRGFLVASVSDVEVMVLLVDFFDFFFVAFFLGRPRIRLTLTTQMWCFMEFLSFGTGGMSWFLLQRHVSIRFFHMSTLSNGNLEKKFPFLSV